MQTSEILNKAADIIQVRGWGVGGGWFPKPDETTPVCVEGALRLCDRSDRRGSAPYLALVAYLTDRYPECVNGSGSVYPWSWNDRLDRTEAEVIEVLRACAVIEASRERETAEVAS